VQARTVVPESASAEGNQEANEAKGEAKGTESKEEPKRVLRPRKTEDQKRSPEEFIPLVVSREEYSKNIYEFTHFPGLKLASEFVKARRSMAGGEKAVDKLGMLRYTKELIPCALTRLPDQKLEQTALELFKSVQGFMGDRHYSFADRSVLTITYLHSLLLVSYAKLWKYWRITLHSATRPTVRWKSLSLSLSLSLSSLLFAGSSCLVCVCRLLKASDYDLDLY